MNERFSTTSTGYDPYHKLLGISAHDQPPTAYRLLGIDLFESDREVIDSAANKQMSYLRDCCNGEHAGAAEQLLNEVTEARLRLLNAASKQEYDNELQSSIANVPQASTPYVPSSPAVAASDSFVPITSPSPIIRATPRSRKKRSGGFRFLINFVAPAILTTVLAWQLGMLPSISIVEVADQPDSPMLAEREMAVPHEQPAISRPTANQSTASPQSTIGTTNTQRQVTAPPSTSISVPAPLETPSPVTQTDGNQYSGGERFFDVGPNSNAPTTTVPKTSGIVTPEKRGRLESFRSIGRDAYQSGSPSGGVPTNNQSMGSRIPVPENFLQEARRKIQNSLATQIRDARSPHDKQHLATICYDLALDTGVPAEKYELLQLAKDSFLDADDCTGALRALNAIESAFDVDLFDERVAAVTKLGPQTYRPSEQVIVADHAEALAATAIQRDQFTAAIDLSMVGKRIARQFQNNAMSRKFDIQIDRASILKNTQSTVQAARDRLVAEPDNAKASEYLGRFLCFGKAAWTEGLTLLQRSEDVALAGVAKAELQLPDSPVAFNEMGDLWWALSGVSDHDEVLAREGQLRALDWYRYAIADGLTGPQKDTAKLRIDQFEAENAGEIAARIAANFDLREPVPPRGVPRDAIHFDGNWYLFSQEKLSFPEAVAIATRAGGRLVVVRTQAENDFLVQHAKRPMFLGMLRNEGAWYDSLGDKQYFFRWDQRSGQPEADANQPLAALYFGSDLWHDYPEKSRMYFAIEWGKE